MLEPGWRRWLRQAGWLVLGALLLLACKKQNADNQSGAAPTPETTTPEQKLELSFAYGSEKKAWLSDAIQRYNASGARVGGQRVVVQGLPLGSGSVVDDIVASAIQPHAWCPPSTLYATLLNAAWVRKQGALGGAAAVAPEGKSIALSPVVIAMWKPMAEALGWPGKSLGWSDILELSRDPRGWSGRAHPEWGPFKLGHTHPGFSNSGLQSVIAEAYAALGKTRELSVEELQASKTAKFVEDIEQSIVHYGESTGFFSDKMLERGPSFLSAAVLYENAVVDSYRRPEFQKRELDLVAIYPKEGTFWIDNPFIVLSAPWVDPPHARAAEAFRDFLLTEAEQTRALSEYGFRPADPKIAVGAPIDPAHGADPKQPQTLLDVPSAPVIDAALSLWKRTKKTVDILFVFDRSGSMNGDPLREAKQGALEFLGQLDDRDRVAFLPFNDQVAEPAELAELSGHRQELNALVQGVFANGGTALYDAIAKAYDKLRLRALRDPKRLYALVVMTDGVDENSKMKLEAVRKLLGGTAETRDNPLRLFTIAYGAKADGRVLASLAEAGGGAYFKGDAASIRKVYRDLAAFF